MVWRGEITDDFVGGTVSCVWEGGGPSNHAVAGADLGLGKGGFFCAVKPRLFYATPIIINTLY